MPKTETAPQIDFPSLHDLISEVKINPIKNPQGKTIAFASIVIADQMVLHGLRIVDGTKGLFVSMPQREGNDGEYYDWFNPITAEARTLLQAKVLEAYEDQEDDRGRGRGRGRGRDDDDQDDDRRGRSGGSGRGRSGGGRGRR